MPFKIPSNLTMKFLRNLIANILAIFIVLFLCFVGIFAIIAAASSEQKVTLSNNAVLKLTFSQPINEIPTEDPFSELNLPMGTNASTLGLKDIKEVLLSAKDDDRIQGIYLKLSGVSAGFGILREVRNALIDFKTSGKFMIAYGEYMTEGAYYLASVADRVALNEAGMLEFNGLAAEKTYYKGMFDKLGIKAQVFKVGSFKSAVEPYIATNMSEADKEQTLTYLNDLYNLYLEDLAESLGKTRGELEVISDSMYVENIESAFEYGLITDIAYEDSVNNIIREELGGDPDDKIPFISLAKYSKAKQTSTKNSSNRVAVILAEGAIVSGEGDHGMIGSDKLVKQLRKARKDKRVKAIVLRVNSPGGSALASDVIWREVQLTKKEKPIIASMSDLAASGGYYIAMGCDTIVALPNTLTGSIGIFSVYFQLDEFLADKVGVTFDEVSTGELSNLGSPFDEFSEFEASKLQKGVNEGYERFTQKAADGRNMAIEDLKKVAGGRVWTGKTAKELGLVDILGGLTESIEVAAAMSGISDDYSVRYYPQKQNLLENIFSTNTFAQLKQNQLKEELGPLYPTFKQIKELKTLQGTQARLPYQITIK